MNAAVVRNVLLAIIALGVVIIAAVLVFGGEDGPRQHSPEWQRAYDDFRETSEVYCSALKDLERYSPEWDLCATEKTKQYIGSWEANLPDRVWAD